MPLTVHQLRGGLTETIHPVSAAVSDGARVVWSVGPDLSSFWRSASKPLQLLTSLAHLDPAVTARLDPEDLAIGAASHSGQPHHVARVRTLMEKLDVPEDGLRCGAHLPMHEATARTTVTALQVHNNCSGKHTFMLAAARQAGLAPDYRPLLHPLQQANLARIRAYAEAEPGVAIDGCGVPTFHLPLSAMARTWGRLVHGADAEATRILHAMRAHPELVSGEDRLDLVVTRAATEPLACKIGAEGLFAVALMDRGLGLVVKVHTGNTDALAVAVKAVLDEVAPGVLRPEAWPWETVKNVVGSEVGTRTAEWS